MVAPNGARRTKADHPAIPVSIEETVVTARACFEAGAGAIHAHVRDETDAHVLDVERYRSLLAQMQQSVPDMVVQITTEAVGRYSAEEQRTLLRELRPAFASIALAELISDCDDAAYAAFLMELETQGTHPQHIVYDAEQFSRLLTIFEEQTTPTPLPDTLFVLGRYTKGQVSTPADLDPFLKILARHPETPWTICAFGPGETDCLARAAELGGRVRVGFENSLWNRDGSVATDNVERVREVTKAIEAVTR